MYTSPWKDMQGLLPMLDICDRQNNDLPKDVHMFIPETYEFVTLHGKKNTL
jgi:hypothetical protein